MSGQSRPNQRPTPEIIVASSDDLSAWSSIAKMSILAQTVFENENLNISSPELFQFHAGMFLKYGKWVSSARQCMATGTITFWSSEEAIISNVAIAEKKRNKGLGSKILAALEGVALDRAISAVHVDAEPATVDFYAANGYAADGLRSDSVIGMTKILVPEATE